MLSCQHCGAPMSGVDLVCKKCGTPWGKKNKKRVGLYFSIFIIILVGAAASIYFNPNVDKTQFINNIQTFWSGIFAKPEENIQTTPAPEVVNEPIEKTPEVKIEEPKNVLPEVTPSPAIQETPQVQQPSVPTFSWISSSSYLTSQGKFNYGPELTVDGKLSTAWLEGAKGTGIGEWIMFSSEAEQTVSAVTLYNGYLKNNIVYTNNGKIRKLSIELSDGTIITKEIPKSTFAESNSGFKIPFGQPVKTTFIKITILDAYDGAYYSDTALSGVAFE